MSIKLPLEIYKGFWQREPGLELCVKECGAYCCRAGVEATITSDESVRLDAKLIFMGGKKLDVYWHKEKKKWRWRIGEPCIFLQEDNMCSIHNERPECCRRFPPKPTTWCPVWLIKPASKELCGDECGARCCKEPGFMLLSPKEKVRLKKLNPNLKVAKYKDKKNWIVWFKGCDCIFLKGNVCSIYTERPYACRSFPSRPHPKCLVWPVRK